MRTTNVETLTINRLSQAQYDAEKQAGTLQPDEIYLTPDTGGNGGGMSAEIYDPQGKEEDIFAYADAAANTAKPVIITMQTTSMGTTISSVENLLHLETEKPVFLRWDKEADRAGDSDKLYIIPLVSYRTRQMATEIIRANFAGVLSGNGDKVWVDLVIAYDAGEGTYELTSWTYGTDPIIEDIDTIRNGAALGATALQVVPSTYRTAAEQDVVDGEKQGQHIACTADLFMWTDDQCTVSVAGVTANNTVIVSPAPAYISAYENAGIYCSSQGNGTLTFSCNGSSVPFVTVNIVILD